MPTTTPEAQRYYTIPPGVPFLDTLAAAILAGDLPRPGGPPPDPLQLAGMTILLPTRRAGRALAASFLRQSGRPALLLPAIRAIADRDEELAAMGAAATGSGGGDRGAGPARDALSLPPAIDDLERLLLLTRLVKLWSETMSLSAADETGALAMGAVASAGARTPAQAVALARELARLMDLVEREGATLAGLANLVPEEHSAHWQATLRFLQIATDYWPQELTERGRLSRYDRQNRLIGSEAARYRAGGDARPVIIAGVTGSIPATIQLMRAVASLPNGAIVLPGLDLDTSADDWASLDASIAAPAGSRAKSREGSARSGAASPHGLLQPDAGDSAAAAPGMRDSYPEHPQFGLARLLARLAVDRASVARLPGASPPAPIAARDDLFRAALQPTPLTARWHDWIATADRAAIAAGLAGVSLIEAATAAEEAEVIALILRHAAEDPERTAALVTPDRLLARRVAIRLADWGIRVDDSAGRPFAKTPTGTLLDLVMACLERDFAPAVVMALLKHPLTRLGLPARDIRRAARALELIAFRTIYIGTGLAGIAAAISNAEADVDDEERREAALRRLWPEDWVAAKALLDHLRRAFTPLSRLLEAGYDEIALADAAAAHLAVARALATPPDEEIAGGAEAEPLFAGPAGEEAAGLFTALAASAGIAPTIAVADYAEVWRALIAGRSVRPSVPSHPRLSIWGPMEARLMRPDVVVLGSLNDGTWPAAADPGPWLNRPMRKALGLPSPEEEIGRQAHDVTGLLGCATVYLTRARKLDGVPMVASRWLLRLEALVGGLGLGEALRPDQPWLAWATHRDHVPDRRTPATPPRPAPPLAARPRRLSVSAVERWLANPYDIFARHILELEPLPRLGGEPDAAMKGALIHAAMAEFAARHPTVLPADPAAELYTIARSLFDRHAGHPRIAAFWLPRFERFARWFAMTEPARRSGLFATHAEVAGKLTVMTPASGLFTLTARADRIDVTATGLVITDYKTGTLPKPGDVVSGRRPQLPLEAAIAQADGFTPGLSRQPVTALRYIRASGAEPPGEESTVAKADVAALAATVLAGLQALASRYDDPAMPYAAVRRAGFDYTFDTYAQLARVAEWAGEEAVLDGDDGTGGAGEP
ncbi:MAG: double-strand break repair protein AddB [Hyphomicrobiaceae bacterium]|nr:double-strand break repair protein AddB [Hyphomicrobiaceae bacterium]